MKKASKQQRAISAMHVEHICYEAERKRIRRRDEHLRYLTALHERKSALRNCNSDKAQTN